MRHLFASRPRPADNLLDPNAELETLQARYKEVDEDWNTKDDVRNSLYFHLKNFGSAQSDLKDVEDLVRQLGELTKADRVAVPFLGEDKKREKAIYRLLRIGVLTDYESDYGSRKYLVDVEKFDLERCGKALLKYVAATQAARAPALERQVEQVSGSPRECVLELARLLIEFTYDVVEPRSSCGTGGASSRRSSRRWRRGNSGASAFVSSSRIRTIPACS